MTIAADRAEQKQAGEQDHLDHSRIRRLQLVVAIMAILTIGLGISLVIVLSGDDDDVTDDVPDDVMQVLDDFATAFAEQDVELMESIIAADTFGVVDTYNPDTIDPAYTMGVTPNVLLREVRDSTFTVERSGDLLVAGDGPWVIAARETWTDPVNREEGTRIYVIVDEDGTPKLGSYYYVNVDVPVVPDSRD